MWKRTGGGGAAYAIQVGRDVAVGIDERLLSSQLDDFADDNNISAHVRIEVGAGDAGGCSSPHGRSPVRVKCSVVSLFSFRDSMMASDSSPP